MWALFICTLANACQPPCLTPEGGIYSWFAAEVICELQNGRFKCISWPKICKRRVSRNLQHPRRIPGHRRVGTRRKAKPTRSTRICTWPAMAVGQHRRCTCASASATPTEENLPRQSERPLLSAVVVRQRPSRVRGSRARGGVCGGLSAPARPHSHVPRAPCSLFRPPSRRNTGSFFPAIQK